MVRAMEPGYLRTQDPQRGFPTAIDCCEDLSSPRWSDKRTVVAWAMAGQIVLRIKDGDEISTGTTSTSLDVDTTQDITAIHLLRPHQRSSDQEKIIVQRDNGELSRWVSDPDNLLLLDKTIYSKPAINPMNYVHNIQTAISNAPRPLLVQSRPDGLQIWDATSQARESAPLSSLSYDNEPEGLRTTCVKFLADDRFALSGRDPRLRGGEFIRIYSLRPDGHCEVSNSLSARAFMSPADLSLQIVALTMAPLDGVCSLAGRTGEVFLTGYSDKVVRLCDLRDPRFHISTFSDLVDDGAVQCLLPLGHEKFWVGSGEDGVRCFDLRMPGSNVYSACPIASSMPQRGPAPHDWDQRAVKTPRVNPARGVNLLLGSLHPQDRKKLGQANWWHRYRVVHALSAPSPASSYFYAATYHNVIKFDFIATDDLETRKQSLVASGFEAPESPYNFVFNSACYERPRSDHVATDPLLLLKQVDLGQERVGTYNGGWDERWRLAGQENGPRSWRRNS